MNFWLNRYDEHYTSFTWGLHHVGEYVTYSIRSFDTMLLFTISSN